MKCPKCSTNNKARLTNKCTSCGYAFVFNPKTDGVSDGFFSFVIRKASANNTQYFTENQLFHTWVVERYKKSTLNTWGCLWVFVIVSGIASYAIVKNPWVLCIEIPILLLGFILPKRTASINRFVDNDLFKSQMYKWKKFGNMSEYFIDKPTLESESKIEFESDIYEHGVSKVLILEEDVLVDLFVRNGIHTKEQVLVLSISGYPKQAYSIFENMIENKSPLTIYCMHSPTPSGLELPKTLSNKYPNYKIVDLGVSAEEFKNMKHYDIWKDQKTWPLDAISFGAIAAPLAICFASQIAFAEALEQQRQTNQSWGDSGGYG